MGAQRPRGLHLRHHGPAERRRAHARGGGGAGVGPGGRVGLVVSRHDIATIWIAFLSRWQRCRLRTVRRTGSCTSCRCTTRTASSTSSAARCSVRMAACRTTAVLASWAACSHRCPAVWAAVGATVEFLPKFSAAAVWDRLSLRVGDAFERPWITVLMGVSRTTLAGIWAASPKDSSLKIPD